MPAHMTLAKPAKGTAQKQRRARKRAADAILAANAAIVRERDGHRCRFCLSDDRVHVHHIRFRSRGGGHETSNLVCLCEAHHLAAHGRNGSLSINGNADRYLTITLRPPTRVGAGAG